MRRVWTLPLLPVGLALIQTTNEDLQLGRMGSDIYLEYFRAGASVLGYVIVGLVVIASQAASLASDWFLASWSTTVTRAVTAAAAANAAQGIYIDENSHSPQLHHAATVLLSMVPEGQVFDFSVESLVNTSDALALASSQNVTLSYRHFLPHMQGFYISIYAVFVISSALLLFFRSVYVAFTTIRSASVLHTRLFQGIIRAPQHFFESTPSGRILNRCSKDTEQVDAVLPGCVQDILACGVVVAGTIVLIVAVAPLSIVELAFIGVLYYRGQQHACDCTQQMQQRRMLKKTVGEM